MRQIAVSGKFVEEEFGLGMNSGPWIEPKGLNSCWIGPATQRRVTETRLVGGERGIRTLDTLPYTHFPGVLLQPLGHLSGFLASTTLNASVFLIHGARLRARDSTASQSHPFGAVVATLRRSFDCASSQPLGHLSGYSLIS